MLFMGTEFKEEEAMSEIYRVIINKGVSKALLLSKVGIVVLVICKSNDD